jgi:hypothetical protein
VLAMPDAWPVNDILSATEHFAHTASAQHQHERHIRGAQRAHRLDAAVVSIAIIDEQCCAVEDRFRPPVSVSVDRMCGWRNRRGESPLLSPPGLESGCFPDSVDRAGHRGVGTPACRSVLGRRSVAQGQKTVAVVVLVLEVADDHAGLE